MSKIWIFKKVFKKNRICDDKKILSSGDKKNNFHFVTIIFFYKYLKIKSVD